ncbi:MAG TPA: YicC family protein [Lachnospiraceae bacterium]|nr:YicC family protein [Lachnospiraceae bacterium]
MIKSMTGFGRGEYSGETLKFTVEMKSVNHRYLDANVRIPKEYAYLDTSIRSELKQFLGRGKVDVFVTYEIIGEAEYDLQFNEHLAQEYVEAYARMAERFHLVNDLTAARLGAQPEIFRLKEDSMDEEEVWSVLKQALDRALEMLVEARKREGENLKADLAGKLQHMETLVEAVEARYPGIIQAYEQRLKEKMSVLLEDTQIDESRLAAEVVLFADKLATDEETVRLKSHIDTMQKELEKGDDIGRKLDFIAQEMNREANTILSKANDLETSNLAIDLKTVIEKIREQVQNIE